MVYFHIDTLLSGPVCVKKALCVIITCVFNVEKADENNKPAANVNHGTKKRQSDTSV